MDRPLSSEARYQATRGASQVACRAVIDVNLARMDATGWSLVDKALRDDKFSLTAIPLLTFFCLVPALKVLVWSETGPAVALSDADAFF